MRERKGGDCGYKLFQWWIDFQESAKKWVSYSKDYLIVLLCSISSSNNFNKMSLFLVAAAEEPELEELVLWWIWLF